MIIQIENKRREKIEEEVLKLFKITVVKGAL